MGSGLPASFVEEPDEGPRPASPGGDPVRPGGSGFAGVSAGFAEAVAAPLFVAPPSALALPPSRDAQETRLSERDDASRRWNEVCMICRDYTQAVPRAQAMNDRIWPGRDGESF